jgi:hypothetical protein
MENLWKLHSFSEVHSLVKISTLFCHIYKLEFL